MITKKPSLATSSENGSETSTAAPSSIQASGDELERLREILIGGHVHGTEQRIGELQAQLTSLRDELESRLDDLGNNVANGLREAQDITRQRDEVVDGELRKLRQLLEAEKDIRCGIGQMLVELGQRLQDVIPEPSEA